MHDPEQTDGRMRTNMKRSAKRDQKVVFVFGGMIGIVVFLYIYGFRILDPTYDGWLFHGLNQTDLIQHYIGWNYFRSSPWHFPIGMMDGILYPDPVSVVYTDSIPLLAIVFKLLSPILPSTFQYFGLFGIASFFLIGGFAAILIFSATNDRIYSILSSILFSTSMVLLIRMYWHTALGAQWIVLAALYLWLNQKKADLSTTKTACIWVLLSCLAISIQAYFLPMVWGTMVCAMTEQLINSDNKKQVWERFFVVILSMALSTLLIGWLLGFFEGTISNEGSGLGFFSFNYNAFFNTFGYTHLIRQRNNIGWGQYEGYCYLGIGIIAVGALNIFSQAIILIRNWRKNKLQLQPKDSALKPGIVRSLVKRAIPRLLFLAGFTLAAAGPQISLGRNVLVRFDLPEFITDLWSVFRSTGRLIWPVYYFLLLMVVLWTYRLYKGRKNRIIIPSLVICCVIGLQLFEQEPYINNLQEHYQTDYTYETSLTDPRWKQIADQYNHFMLYPDTNRLYNDYTIQCQGQELLIFALENGKTVNTNYIARNASDKVNRDVYEWFAGDSVRNDTSTVYVFLDQKPEEACGLTYYTLNGITVGVPEK